MKLPRRPWYPVDLGKDVFGLSQPTLVELAGESDAEQAQRYAVIELWLAKAFHAADSHLGEKRARDLFTRVSRSGRGRGQGKDFAPDRDARLLAAYDEGNVNGKNLRSIARELHAKTCKRPKGERLGASAQAIETQLRKLLKERRRRAVEARRWRMALAQEPPTLVECADSEN